MTTNPTPEDRAAFELYVTGKKLIGDGTGMLERLSGQTHRYRNASVDLLWEGFQAGLAHARAWRPISEAPRDGEPVMLYSPNCRMVGACIQVGWWSPDDGDGGGVWHNTKGAIGYHSNVTGNRQGDPTHWQPLSLPPTPPEQNP